MSTGDPGLWRLIGSWTPDPPVLALLAAAALLYAAGALRTPQWPIARVCAFLGGLGVLALALLSGLDAYSARLLSVHMVQHLLLMLAAPALLLCGAPVRLALAAVPRWRRPISRLLHRAPLRLLVHPAVGFAAFAGVTLATHLTGAYQAALHDPALHALEHAAYFWAGMLFLAPLIGSDPLPRRPGPLASFALLMGAMVAMAAPGALLAFGTTVRYPSYLPAARLQEISALADQHVAGAVMWIGSGLAMFALAVTLAMQALLAEERRQRRRDGHAARAPLAQVAAPGASHRVVRR
ncbi:MAG: cytochrome c oxidase assembly protein [Actinobacteria bacterium]|nr:MAG: cytochrome c oxidase assembly protein [Actinomycetota bacterium]